MGRCPTAELVRNAAWRFDLEQLHPSGASQQPSLLASHWNVVGPHKLARVQQVQSGKSSLLVHVDAVRVHCVVLWARVDRRHRRDENRSPDSNLPGGNTPLVVSQWIPELRCSSELRAQCSEEPQMPQEGTQEFPEAPRSCQKQPGARKIDFPLVLKRKKSERGPGSQLRLAAGNPPTFKDEELYCRKTTLQTSTDHLPTHPDTQLGAFGPGADPTRSRAAYPPPRLAVNLFVFCCWHLGSLDFASWRLDLGVLEASWRQDWASWRPD